MKNLKDLCKNCTVSFEEKLLDGKNSDVIIDQSRSSDLTILGAQGLGAVTGQGIIGSNTERVLRHTKNDVMIMRKKCDFRKIFVGVDGSDNSYIALQRAIQLAKLFNSKVTILTSFDPQLHPIVFKSLASVLSDEAGKIFKFKEQEQLHNSVIDTSLEELYRGYLETGKKIAETQGISPKIELESLAAKAASLFNDYKEFSENPEDITISYTDKKIFIQKISLTNNSDNGILLITIMPQNIRYFRRKVNKIAKHLSNSTVLP